MPRVKEAVRRWWLSQLIGGLQFAIQPDEVPTVQAVGPAPYRVLLLGGGVSVGLGVSRRVVALPGHLARHLAAITGRGVDVHVCAWLGMTISDARAEVSRTDVSEYDAIVVALGVADLLALGSSETWRRESEQLLSGLLQRSPRARVVVIGVDTTFWSPYVHPAVARAAGHRVGQFNAISRELCWGLARASYLRAPPKQSAPNTHHSVADYERCGRAVAAHLAERLMPAAAVPASTSGGADPGSGVALDDLGLLDLPFDAVVARVVARVRSVFGVEGSSLTRLGPQDAARNSMALSAGRATSEGAAFARARHDRFERRPRRA